MALPYLPPPGAIAGIQPYAAFVLGGLASGGIISWWLSRRFTIPPNDVSLLIAVAIGVAFVAGHLFDVVIYQWDAALDDPGLWTQLNKGHSLFGALLAVAIATVAIARTRKLELARLADVVTVGTLFAIAVGRIGCALVHDHPGIPTDSVFGVDFPQGDGGTVRAHDTGLEELMLVTPLALITLAALWRRPRAGLVAAISALVYAGLRFFLDGLRLPSTEPRFAGLTVGQWGCLVLATLGVAGLAWILVRKRPG